MLRNTPILLLYQMNNNSLKIRILKNIFLLFLSFVSKTIYLPTVTYPEKTGKSILCLKNICHATYK